ncbi:hypothetical protein [Polyangium aurulentum]|uniref:hypothetical protein n=1 Tax=Polyangium aurulentum TaxID=2567896 RepID=UPI00197EAFC4|nr:hypothetical protein [Polyangium aurulentum]UQA58733.1 hypothetical protein E8A73_047145 [Polyangium aurulentum]
MSIKAIPFFVLAVLGSLVACGGGGGGTGGSGGSGGASSSSSGGDGGTGGCGGGCVDPGQCYDTADCAAGEFCQLDNCYPIGQCKPNPTDCPAVADQVCGCNGTVYDNACAAAAAGQSGYLSFTECSNPPAGEFACGTGYCKLDTEYCRQGTDGALACAAKPAECGADSDCECLSGKTNCSVCMPAKGGGLLLTVCK